MSLAEGAFEPSLRGGPCSPDASASATLYRLPIYVSCTLLALACTFLLGKDMPWDTLHYHLYAGFSALHDRFDQDYFAAGPQSYFNPYAYVPFYALVRAGLPALWIGSVLALLHSSLLWLTYELAVCVCSEDPRRVRVAVGLCAVALAFLNPILVQQLGSSLADITTAIPVLAAWLLLTRMVRAPTSTPLAWAGLLLGAATALKLTNAVHALAGYAFMALLPLPLSGRIRYGLRYALALGLGFAIAAAPWSYRLEQHFGNPFFPLLNSLFRSPYFTTESLRLFRFIPGTLVEALWRPFAILNPVAMVHEELRAPDLRYAALVVLSMALGAHWLWARARSSPQPAVGEHAAGRHMLTALGCGLALDWSLWLYGSGNSRYFLPMASVAAVLLMALLFRLLATRRKLRNYLVTVILAIQAFQLCMGADHRWNPVLWSGQWFRVVVPEKLLSEPNLYLTIGVQSNSFIAPFLARGSGLVNFSGGYALGSQGPGGERVAALIRRYSPHVRVLIAGTHIYPDDAQRQPRLSRVDGALRRFGLRVALDDCSTIAIRDLPPDFEITFETSAPPEPPSADTNYLVTCAVNRDDSDRSAWLAQERAADLVLDRLEDACPEVFQPRRLQTENIGSSWQRSYMNTDLLAWVSKGEVRYRDLIWGGDIVRLGHASDWARAPQQLACGREHGRFLARMPLAH